MVRLELVATVALGLTAFGCTPPPEEPARSGGGKTVGVGGEPESSRRALAPPISGGTLALSASGEMAVASDPDNDRIWIVSVEQGELRGSVTVPAGAEPGRVVIDRELRAHVLLRRSGEVVSFPIYAHSRSVRRAVCAEPRGITVEPDADQLIVACAGGELVWLPASEGGPSKRLFVEPDLRDVIVREGFLVVSKFRSAEVLTLAADGTIVRRVRPSHVTHLDLQNRTRTFEPFVAWRLVELGDQGFLVVHQRGQDEPIDLSAAGPDPATGGATPYGGSSSVGCPGILHSAITAEDGSGVLRTQALPGALPVDVAYSPVHGTIAVVTAASNEVVLATVRLDGFDACSGGSYPTVGLPSQPVAVAFRPAGQLVVQMRNPTRLDLSNGVVLTLDPHERHELGHQVFHRQPESTELACASCHPEATEDGRVWSFSSIGPRRTQPLAGGLTGTAPFHWDGDLGSMQHLVDEVFVRRMGASVTDPSTAEAVLTWLDSVPAERSAARASAEAVARGEALFHDAEVGCATCHSGDLYTNNASVDVGTGGTFQVPSLRSLGTRSRFMHDGCATTLADRFGPCGGGDRHGRTSHLTEAERADLVAFLETL